MCLYSLSDEYSVAEEDITVYKYVAKRYRVSEGRFTGATITVQSYWGNREYYGDNPETVWKSPYNHKLEYPVGETVRDHAFQEHPWPGESMTEVTDITGNKDYAYRIEGGLHTFEDIEVARGRAAGFKSIDMENGVLECVIPKGTRYWKGWGRLCPEYCSEALRVVRVVAEYNSLERLSGKDKKE